MNRSIRCGLLLAGLALMACGRGWAQNAITQDELVRRTQELFYNVALGNHASWKPRMGIRVHNLSLRLLDDRY